VASQVVKEPLEITSWIVCDGDIDPVRFARFFHDVCLFTGALLVPFHIGDVCVR
jgi:hypothetical protein